MPAPLQPAPRPWHVWLFPVVLFAFATLFLGGRIGWWTDDYWHNLRDPITGRPTAWTMSRGFFLRPLFYRVVPAVTTWSWRAQWPAHVLEAVWFGAVCVSLWALLIRLGVSRRIAAAATLLFMVYPAQFETMFWVAALPTSMSCLVMLTCMHLMVGFAGRRLGWWVAPVIAGLVYMLCCLNEQAAAGVAGLPLVYWAALPRDGPGARPDESPGASRGLADWARALVPTALAGVAGAFYTWQVLSDPNKLDTSRGSVESMVRARDAWPHLLWFTDILWRRMVLKNFAEGAILSGLRTVRGAGPVGVAFGAALAISAWLWLRAWIGGPASALRTVPGRLIMLGLGVFVTGWLPIYIFSAYEPDSRTRTWPCIGLAIALSGALSLIRPSIAARPAARLGAGLALIAVLIPSALMLVGVQGAFRARYERDQVEGRALQALMPNPPPLTFFLPIRIDETAPRLPSPVFSAHVRSVWEAAWTAPKFIESLYHRTDVHCGYCRRWTPGVPLRGADETGLYFTDRLGPRFPAIGGSGSRIHWDRAVPFIIDAEGRLHLVTRVLLPSTHPGERTQIRIPLAPPGTPDLAISLPRA